MNRMRALTLSGMLCAGALLLFPLLPVSAAPPVHIRAGIGWHGGYPARYPVHIWARGNWHHGWYGPRFGWWWVVGPSWYYYPTPVYPYPAYPPVIVQTTPAKPGPAPAQYWYYCAASKAYYPYVAQCPGGWQQVPVTPPPSASTHP